jgi:dual specificity phosphatase 12
VILADLMENNAATEANVHIEYLPCVATFDSYVNESGKRVRYLVSVVYHDDLHPEHGDLNDRPTSLLQIFDIDRESEENHIGEEAPHFRGIAGVAVGSGIEGEEDVERIRHYFGTMIQASSRMKRNIPVECIQPNNGFATMREEQSCYKNMDDDEKDEATKQGTLGPGRMAKFVAEFARNIVRDAFNKRRGNHVSRETSAASAIPDTSVSNGSSVSSAQPPPSEPEADVTKDRFSCRKCRRILFGQGNCQDPPHGVSQHDFGYRYRSHVAGTSAGNACQSYFLQNSLVWMGDMSEEQGKITCPKCATKVGTWSWSGAQCSCGTWVVPAIQIPKSKVDVVPPKDPELLDGTAVSPVVLWMLQQQEQRSLQNMNS